MNEAPAYQPVIINPEELPKTPKATLWDWVKYYVWNLYRKPLVWKRQQELERTFNDLKTALEYEVLKPLWANRLHCDQCRDAYMALKPQIFLSQIHLILKRMYCRSHAGVFTEFLMRHDSQFSKSEEIAAWINGFRGISAGGVMSSLKRIRPLVGCLLFA
jgi:hypothetical protein